MNKKDSKAIQKYIEAETTHIMIARSKVMEAGAEPKVLYIGDIFPRKKDELRLSAMLLDTGCTIFGMKIIADFRVPVGNFYITQGELTKEGK